MEQCGCAPPREAWAIVLAAGDGSRLQAVTRGVPKQFWRPDGERSLLSMALARAGRVAEPARTLVVVAEGHRRWWRRELARHPAGNVLVQPENRGTAAGLLLPLLTLLERDPAARVAVLPSDHFVRDEPRLATALCGALEESAGGHVVLLGIEPGWAETGYGWILPGAADGSVLRVAEFVEKPGADLARACLERGGVWNSFLIAAEGRALRALFRARTPQLAAAFEALFAGRTARPGALARLYRELEVQDFSRHVLQGAESRLRLCVAPECGWTDLGTPERVARSLVEGRSCARDPALPGRRPLALAGPGAVAAAFPST